jgi:inosine/xanthosine triphosphatase
MLVLVGSTNPVKIESTRIAFALYFDNLEVRGISVSSGVPDQPIGDETFIGARNRVAALAERNHQENLGASYFVGIEGGMYEMNHMWFSFGCVCIGDPSGRISFGTSPHFVLPKDVETKVLGGTELGLVMDELVSGHNTKQAQGAIGILTKGRLDRQELYKTGIICALAPFVNQELFAVR